MAMFQLLNRFLLHEHAVSDLPVVVNLFSRDMNQQFGLIYFLMAITTQVSKGEETTPTCFVPSINVYVLSVTRASQGLDLLFDALK